MEEGSIQEVGARETCSAQDTVTSPSDASLFSPLVGGRMERCVFSCLSLVAKAESCLSFVAKACCVWGGGLCVCVCVWVGGGHSEACGWLELEVKGRAGQWA